MRPTISSCAVFVSVLSLAPIAGMAQSRHAIAFHVGRNDALPLETTLGGISYTSWAGILGVRASGALGLGRVERTATNSDGTLKITAWTADGDVILSPFRMVGPTALGGLQPFALGGIGGHGARYPDGDRASVATVSYGWGVAWQLSRALAVEGTARRRTLLQEEFDLPPGFANDWEYRVGIAFEFGGRRQAERARSPRRRRGPVRVEREPEHEAAREDPRDDDTRTPVLAKPGRMPGASVSAASVIRTANRYEGIRYAYGGATPTKGFDCSGFVQYVFARHGIDLPRTARQIADVGEPISLDRGDLREGDLLFFAGSGTRIDHVAIYLGEDRIIHSTASGGGVRVESLTTPRGEWFDRRLVAARRLVSGGRAIVRPLEVEGDAPLDPPDNAPPPAR
ncbi:MAG TPA: C40 family peptidase [Gemmatimonadaceae bacterium]|nr:C40 family peptidase [Gemmatimonadaceae bacterium]